MTPKEHLIHRLKVLCGASGGAEAVADQAGISADNLKQILAGTTLPSGAPRGVGPSIQRKLDAAYPGWAALGDERDLVRRDPSDDADYNAMPTAFTLRSALGQIAEKMRGADPTHRELVALLMRDIAVRPEALETTLGMLFKVTGLVDESTAAKRAAQMEPMNLEHFEVLAQQAEGSPPVAGQAKPYRMALAHSAEDDYTPYPGLKSHDDAVRASRLRAAQQRARKPGDK